MPRPQVRSFTQREFYQLFAYFNQVPERGNAFKYGNSPPTAARLRRNRNPSLPNSIVSSPRRNGAKAVEPQLTSAQRTWEATAARRPEFDWAPSRALAVQLSLNGNLEGHINPDPAHTEKSLYGIENGAFEKTAPVTGHPEWKDGEGSYGQGPLKQAAELTGGASSKWAM